MPIRVEVRVDYEWKGYWRHGLSLRKVLLPIDGRWAKWKEEK